MSRVLFPLLLLLTLVAPDSEARRLALVVGNDSYRHVSELRNARSDAKAVAKALEAAGFDVNLKEDLGEKGMKAALRDFRERIEGGDDAVFYFSGHGVQLGAANYLLPVDIASDSVGQVRDDALPLQRVLDDLQDQKARFTLAIVDACRNNPFKGRGRTIGGRGLVPVNPATGQMVLYSAGTGQEALDRLTDHDRNPNGVFTRILIKEMNQPGVPVDQVLREVRDQVVMLTKGVNHDQVPAMYDATVGRFYLVPGEAARQRQTPTTTRVAPVVDTAEADYWAEVTRSDDADSYAAYLSTYPNGMHVADANEWIERDRQARAARVKLKEDQAWKQAQSGNDYDSYQAYLSSYPNGRFAALAQLKLKKLTPPLKPGQTFKDCDACPEMVVVPGGSFEMGSPGGEEGRDADEGPLHTVRVQAFALGKTELTVGEFRAFVNDTGYRTDAEKNTGAQGCYSWDQSDGKYEWRAGRYWDSPGFDQSSRQPVVCVSWNDAKAYVDWLERKTGKAYRLPSEAEWEYAARAGTATARYWGDDPNRACSYANVADQTKGPGGHGFGTKHECSDGYWFTAPVSSFRPNAFGLYDMIGNAWEWVEDCYHDSYSGAPTDGSAWTGGSCDKRVLRGASWNYGPRGARSAGRRRNAPSFRYGHYGFRVVFPARTN